MPSLIDLFCLELAKPSDGMNNYSAFSFIHHTSADSYLMIGDLIALFHLYMIRRNLPQNKQVEGIVYARQLNELYTDVDRKRPFDVHEMPQNLIEQIVSRIKKIIPKMAGRKMVYMVIIGYVWHRPAFQKGIELGSKTKPFWNPGKKGLE